MPETILVVGGTGMLGEPVVRQLIADGHHVRVLSRNSVGAGKIFSSMQNVTCFQGNVYELESLRTAMENCTGVHINLSGGDLEAYGTQQVVKVAQGLVSRKMLRRITLISGVTTCKENCWYEGTKAKLQAETHLIESGFDYTIFRCTMFMETLPKWKFVLGEQPTKWHWLAARDYARMVSKSFTTSESACKVLFLYGPEPAYTLKEAVDQFFIPICASDRCPIPNIPMQELQTTTRTDVAGSPEKDISKFQWLGKVRELGDPSEANDLLDAPTISLGDWCKDYLTKELQSKTS